MESVDAETRAGVDRLLRSLGARLAETVTIDVLLRRFPRYRRGFWYQMAGGVLLLGALWGAIGAIWLKARGDWP